MIHFSLPGKCGDVVLSTAALRHWLKLHPEEHVVFWTEKECAWVYRHWKQVHVKVIEHHNIQTHFKKELVPYLQSKGATQVVFLNAWPDRLDVFSQGHNLLTSFFAFAGVDVPSPPFRLHVSVKDSLLKKQVAAFTERLVSPFVIISRFSHTVPQHLTNEWWSKFVKKLIDSGVTVVDNIAGDETKLPGTISIVNWPYPKVLLLSQLAKATIGVRSGLTDVVAAGGGRLLSLIPVDYQHHLTYSGFKLEGDIIDILYKELPPHNEVMKWILAGNPDRIARCTTY